MKIENPDVDLCAKKGAVNCGGRREFLVKATTIAGSVVLSLSGLNVAQGQKENSKMAAAKTDDLVLKLDASSPLSKVGGSLTIESSAGKILVLRNGEMSFAAFSAKCMHKGGPVSLNEKTKQLVCAWHGSAYDPTDGRVLNGPASQKLPAFATESAVVVALTPKS